MIRAALVLTSLATSISLGTLSTRHIVAAELAVYINEIQVSNSGTDWVLVELQGEPSTDLSNLTLAKLDGDIDRNSGLVDLSGQAIPADGFWQGISPAGTSEDRVSGQLSFDDNGFDKSTAI